MDVNLKMTDKDGNIIAEKEKITVDDSISTTMEIVPSFEHKRNMETHKLTEEMKDHVIETLNKLSQYIKYIENIMYPVLNRTNGPSLHHQLNAVRVFPFDIPEVEYIFSISRERTTNESPEIFQILYAPKLYYPVYDCSTGEWHNIECDQSRVYQNIGIAHSVILPEFLFNLDGYDIVESIMTTYITNIRNVVYNKREEYHAYISNIYEATTFGDMENVLSEDLVDLETHIKQMITRKGREIWGLKKK